jgi:hypothetical protein
MRVIHVAASLLLTTLVTPPDAAAIVVVRHAAYVHPHAVVVAPAPVMVVAPAPVVLVAPAPQPAPPPPPPLTSALPVDTTMWVLPSGCTKVALSGQTYYQCGPSWLRPVRSDKGTYYAVVPPPP